MGGVAGIGAAPQLGEHPMSISRLPHPSEGGNFTPVPIGTWPAICYRVIDLGTQDTTYNGQPKRQHKVLLSFELRSAKCLMDDGRPMTIHQRFTWSLNENATLRQMLESWRGKKFTEEDFQPPPRGFEIRKVIGVSCFLSVVHNGDGGRVFSNINAIVRLPDEMRGGIGKLENPTVYISLDPEDFDFEAFAALPDRLKDTIMRSPEYKALQQGHQHSNGGDPGYNESNLEREHADDIPF